LGRTFLGGLIFFAEFSEIHRLSWQKDKSAAAFRVPA